MKAFLATEFLCSHCLMPLANIGVIHGRVYVYCQNKECAEYQKHGSYPLQEVHLQPEEMNG